MTSKKDLAQKIAVMQVANAGGLVYTKSENSDVWAKTKNPVFNWGISDYKVVTSTSSLLTNPANTTLNYTDLVTKLNYLERGKNLGDEIDYATEQIGELESTIKSDISEKIDIDCSSLDRSSLLRTNFFKKLIDAVGGDDAVINNYVAEIQQVAAQTIRTSIVNAANKIVGDSINQFLANLPESDAALYENNAPTAEDLKATITELAGKIAEAYPAADDGTIIEFEQDGITLRFWKNLEKENVLSVSYDLAKATIGASPEYSTHTNYKGDVTYSAVGVTHTELNNAIADAIATTQYNDTILQDNILQSTEYYVNSLHDIILGEIDDKIEASKPSFLHDATEKAADMDAIFYRELKASFKSLILEVMYPVGSYYMTETAPNNGGNPAELFGGKWERITDRFIIAASDAYPAGTTGGEAVVTLTTDQIPAHTHGVYDPGHSHSAYAYIDRGADDNNHTGTNFGSGDTNGTGDDINQTVTVVSATTGISLYNTGGGGAHNNIPPYIAAYIWKRTE